MQGLWQDCLFHWFVVCWWSNLSQILLQMQSLQRNSRGMFACDLWFPILILCSTLSPDYHLSINFNVIMHQYNRFTEYPFLWMLIKYWDHQDHIFDDVSHFEFCAFGMFHGRWAITHQWMEFCTASPTLNNSSRSREISARIFKLVNCFKLHQLSLPLLFL